MNRRLSLAVLLALLALAAMPAAASAGWFPAAGPLDGPSPDIEKLGGVDLARDGTGGLVYIKRADGVPHVFLSRFNGGQFRPPERVDVNLGDAATDAAIAASDGHRLAIVWTAGTRVWGSVVPGGTEQPGGLLGPSLLHEDASGTVSDPAIDMGINNTAFATWAAPGGGGSDVRVARLTDTSWQGVGAPMDVDPPRAAGRTSQRPRVSVSAEGNAVVAWGEDHADGRPRVYMRRVTGLTPSSSPQEASVGDLGGAGGGRADSIDIDVEDDGSFAWAVFRQDIGGVSRTLARRLLGSTFDPPVPLDGGGGTQRPRIAINGRGQGLATFEGGGGVLGAFNYNDVFEPTQPLHSVPVTGPEPLPASSEHREVIAAWQVNGEVKARLKPEPTVPFEGEVTLSKPDLGPVTSGNVAVAADRLAGFAVAMIQGAPGAARSLTVGVHDRLPGRPGAIARSAWQSSRRPRLQWRPGRELWGPQRFRVVIGGRAVGETTGTSLRPAARLQSGRPLTYQVIAIDSRGQESPSRTRRVRFDNVAPRITVRVIGRRRAGSPLRIRVRARDGRGSGTDRVRVRFGDGSGVQQQRRGFRFRHAYRRGRFVMRVAAFDEAGNGRVKRVRLRIS